MNEYKTDSNNKNRSFSPVPLGNIAIHDTFWSKYINLVFHEVIPYQWNALNDNVPEAPPSHSLGNFRIAASLSSGVYYGTVFQDSDTYKWIEAVSYMLSQHPDKELEKKVDDIIAILGAAQLGDGYLHTYCILNPGYKRWSNLTEGHELYCAGHLIEAAVAYTNATGKRNLLDIAVSFADLITETFGPGPGQIKGYPGHQEIELALVKLYHLTKAEKYLQLAKFFLDIRGTGDNWFLAETMEPGFKHIFPEFSGYEPVYSQSHLPVRQQETVEGHAVRALYMYSGMADVAYETGDEQLLAACRTLWDNFVQKRMYITGSAGSSGFWERFTTDYDLPNDRNYSESCASVAIALFGIRMARIFQDASFIDVLEQALYNTILAGMAQDGKSFFYVNPMEVIPDNCLEHTTIDHVKPERQKWFGVACCPTNIARTLASLGSYIFTVEDDTVFVNLFVSCTAEVSPDVTMHIDTNFPLGNEAAINVRNESSPMKLAIRLPHYAEHTQVSLNGIPVSELEVEQGFLRLDTIGLGESTIHVAFSAPPVFMRANPRVSADVGKVAVKRGPVVYCFEEEDNGSGLYRTYIDTGKPLQETYDADLGIVKIQAAGRRVALSGDESLYLRAGKMDFEDVVLTAVPYYYWANRNLGEMAVWMKELVL